MSSRAMCFLEILRALPQDQTESEFRTCLGQTGAKYCFQFDYVCKCEFLYCLQTGFSRCASFLELAALPGVQLLDTPWERIAKACDIVLSIDHAGDVL